MPAQLTAPQEFVHLGLAQGSSRMAGATPGRAAGNEQEVESIHRSSLRRPSLSLLPVFICSDDWTWYRSWRRIRIENALHATESEVPAGNSSWCLRTGHTGKARELLPEGCVGPGKAHFQFPRDFTQHDLSLQQNIPISAISPVLSQAQVGQTKLVRISKS